VDQRDVRVGRLAELIAPRLGIDSEQKSQLVRAMPELKARAHDLNQLADGAGFLFAARPLQLEPAAAELVGGEAPSLLARAHAALAQAGDWEHDALDAAVRKVADEAGVKLGKLAQPLRAALTGKTTSPGIFDVLVLLGREESLARIADQMKELTND
jgi:glutamyl-tRNA synthetase